MTNFQQPRADEVRVKRGLTTVILFFVTVFLGFYAIKTGSLVFMVGLVALPVALILSGQPKLAFTLAMVLSPLNLNIIRELDVSFLLRIMVCGIFFLGMIMGRKPWRGVPLPEKKPLLLFFCVVVLLMMFRGSGLKILGSSTWGGTVYVYLIVSILFFFVCNGLKVNKRAMKWMIYGSIIAGFVGAGLTHLGVAESEVSSGFGESRMTWVIPISSACLALAFVIRSPRKRLIGTLFFGLALAIMALSGFRSRLVGMLLVIGIFGFFKSRNKASYVAGGLVAGCVLWLAVVAISPVLPPAMQRAVSFVPGATVNAQTFWEAKGSIDWRLEIWAYALERAVPFLMIGRGAAFDVANTISQMGQSEYATFTPWMAFLTHSYHSGPVELLLDYGIPGLIAVIWLHVLVFRRMWRLSVRLAPLDTPESRYISYRCASIMWEAAAYYLVFGAIVGFTGWLISTAITMVMANSLLEAEKCVSAERGLKTPG